MLNLQSRSHNCIYAINGQTNRRNYINFKSNLAMMVIYYPVKFEFDWTKRFRVRSLETEMLMDRQTNKKWTHEQTELHQFRKEPSYDGDLSPCQV